MSVTAIRRDGLGLYDLYTENGFIAKVSEDYIFRAEEILNGGGEKRFHELLYAGCEPVKTDIIDACWTGRVKIYG